MEEKVGVQAGAGGGPGRTNQYSHCVRTIILLGNYITIRAEDAIIMERLLSTLSALCNH